MTEEQNTYVKLEKQSMASGTPFQVKSKEPNTYYKTNYAYYLKQKADNAPLRPLIGKMENDKFSVFLDGVWVEKSLWDDFSEEVIENGKQVLNTKGNVRKRLLFDQKFDWLLEFEKEIPIEYYNKEEKRKVIENHKTMWVSMSKNLNEKLQEQLNDPRTPDNSFLQINFDMALPPADMYKIVFVK